MQKRIFINNQIRANEVRLIDETGKQIGVVQIGEALRMAQEKNLDLIQVTEKVEPPVCKLANYGKYLYQLEKKERKEKKHTGGEMKEIRLTFTISQHDLETRANQAQKFLERGDAVRIAMRMRGREKALTNFAKEKIEKFLEMVRTNIPIKIEREVRMEPRGLAMMITKQ